MGEVPGGLKSPGTRRGTWRRSYLPPPSGRLNFSYNPLAICKELIGPDTVIKLICCCLCVLCLLVIAFGGMYYTSFYTMYESMF